MTTKTRTRKPKPTVTRAHWDAIENALKGMEGTEELRQRIGSATFQQTLDAKLFVDLQDGDAERIAAAEVVLRERQVPSVRQVDQTALTVKQVEAARAKRSLQTQADPYTMTVPELAKAAGVSRKRVSWQSMNHRIRLDGIVEVHDDAAQHWIAQMGAQQNAA